MTGEFPSSIDKTYLRAIAVSDHDAQPLCNEIGYIFWVSFTASYWEDKATWFLSLIREFPPIAKTVRRDFIG